MAETVTASAPDTHSETCYQYWQVSGRVQGVGFRPFVYRLARAHHLAGRVWNAGDGVHISLWGRRRDLQTFEQAFRSESPAAAAITQIRVSHQPPATGYTDFQIDTSQAGAISTEVVPDMKPCRQCIDEMLDPGNRRYRYPFINCTHCGPRYTIIAGLPYDRPNTSMAGFAQCSNCIAEYLDPANRRFHAQPNACAHCGPGLELMDLQGQKQQGASAIDTAAELLRAGKILAIKGIGGYQLVCDATRADTVRLLRERKHRPDKPFALMVANIASLEHWVHSTPADLERLASAAAPVVLMPARDPARLTAIAPGLDQLGLMLPSSPLHILLFHAALGKPDGNRWLEQPQSLLWVATSANLTGAPLIIDDEAAQAQLLGPVADAVLSHNRPILQRCDDSVWQGGEQPQIIRRARGFAPASQPLGFTARPTLALGAALKNTLCLAHGQSAFVSQHIGDLQHPECRAALEHTAKHLMNTFAVRPEQVAFDAHPDTPGFHFAEQLARQWAVPLLRIQHHHAHIAAVLAEHGFSPELAHPVIGIALDGFGYGSDGTAWGGELFLFKGGSVRRIGHLRPLRLPGGDMAAREPWRMALSALHETGQQAAMARFREQPGYAIVRQMLDKNSHCPVSTSGGRWFDAVSALLGGPTSQSYEGQAAMVLETMARQYSGDQPQGHTPAFAIEQGVLDLRPALEDTLDAGDSALAALRWHQNLTAAVACWATQAAEQRGAGHIVFSGGCLSNQLLRRGLLQAFSKYSAPLLLPVAMPANDGGISLGQVWMAHFGNQTQCHQKSTTNESSDHVSCHTRSS